MQNQRRGPWTTEFWVITICCIAAFALAIYDPDKNADMGVRLVMILVTIYILSRTVIKATNRSTVAVTGSQVLPAPSRDPIPDIDDDLAEEFLVN